MINMTKQIPLFICFLFFAMMLRAEVVDDFEKQKVGAFPAKCYPYSGNNKDGISIKVIADNNNKILRLAADGTKGKSAGIVRYIKANPNTRYRMSFRARGVTPGEVRLQVAAVLHNPTEKPAFNVYKKESILLAADQWKEIQFDVQTQSLTRDIVLEIHSQWSTRAGIDIDDIRLEQYNADGELLRFGQRKDFKRELCLNTNLLAAKIVVANQYHRRLAEQINQILPSPLPVVDANEYASKKNDSHLIMIGNADDNPDIFNLYIKQMVILDSRYPGKGGFNVRTLHNPRGDGYNVIFVGGSDDAGHSLAVAEFCRIAKGTKKWILPQTAAILYPKAKALRMQGECEWDGFFNYDPVSRNMTAFYMTGNPEYMKTVEKIAFPADEAQVRKNNASGRYDDGRTPIAKPYHYWGAKTAIVWDMIEEDTQISPLLREKITSALYDQMQYWISSGAGYRIYQNPVPHTFLRDRHYLMEAFCVYTVARFFDKYYPGPDSREGLRCAAYVFAPIWERLTVPGIWRTWLPSGLFPALQYALLSDYQRCQTSPEFRAFAELWLMNSSLRPDEWLNHFPGLAGQLAYALDDAAYARLQSLKIYAPDGALLGPAFYNPERKFSKDTLAKWQGHWIRSHFDAVKNGDRDIPAWLQPGEVDAFYSYRSRKDALGDYLLFVPRYTPGARGSYFNASIDHLMLNGRCVLEGTSQLFLRKNNLSNGKMARYSKILSTTKVGDSVFLSVLVRDFNGHDWIRTLLLRQGKFLLALDQITAKEENLCRIDNDWKPGPYSCLRVNSAHDLVIEDASARPAGCLAEKVGPMLFSSEFPRNKFYDSFAASVFMPLWKEGESFVIPFDLPQKTADANIVLVLMGGAPGSIDLFLDGKKIKENFSLPKEQRYTRIVVPVEHLAGGLHQLALTASSVCNGWRVRALYIAPEVRSGGDFTISSTLNGDSLAVPVKMPHPAGAAPIDGFRGRFKKMLSLATGQRVNFATLIREGTVPGAAAGQKDHIMYFCLPDGPGRIVDGGAESFILEERTRLAGYGIKRVKGLFERSTPVAFDYNHTDGMLYISEENGNVTATKIANFQMPDAHWAANVEQQLLSIPNGVTVLQPDARELDTKKEIIHNSPIQLIKASPDAIAVASGNLLTIYRNGVPLWQKTLPDTIGALHFWEKFNLWVTGDRKENITAFAPDGSIRFQTKSESSPDLIRTNKNFWFKSSYPGVYALVDAEIQPGKSMIFAGSTGTIEAIDENGKTLQRFWHDYGPVDEFAYRKANEQQDAELFCGRSFGAFPQTGGIVWEKGRMTLKNRGMLWDSNGNDMSKFGYVGIGKRFLQMARIVPEEPARLLGAFDGVQNVIMLWDAANSRILGDVNLGSGEPAIARDYRLGSATPRNIRGVSAVDFGHSSKIKIAVATADQVVMLFDCNLKLVKIVPMVSDVTTLCGGQGFLAILLTDRVVFLDGTGGITTQYRTNGRATALIPSQDGFVVGTDKGQLSWIAN